MPESDLVVPRGLSGPWHAAANRPVAKSPAGFSVWQSGQTEQRFVTDIRSGRSLRGLPDCQARYAALALQAWCRRVTFLGGRVVWLVL